MQYMTAHEDLPRVASCSTSASPQTNHVVGQTHHRFVTGLPVQASGFTHAGKTVHVQSHKKRFETFGREKSCAIEHELVCGFQCVNSQKELRQP